MKVEHRPERSEHTSCMIDVIKWENFSQCDTKEKNLKEKWKSCRNSVILLACSTFMFMTLFVGTKNLTPAAAAAAFTASSVCALWKQELEQWYKLV